MALIVQRGDQTFDHRVERRKVRADKVALGGKQLAEKGDERFGRWVTDAQGEPVLDGNGDPAWEWDYDEVEDVIGSTRIPLTVADDKAPGVPILAETFAFEINVGNPRATELAQAASAAFRDDLLARAAKRANVIAKLTPAATSLEVR